MKPFLVIVFLLVANISFAQDSRWVDLEWESVPNAREYEIQLFQEEDGKELPRGKYKTDVAQWSHSVPPGKYFLILRSIDKRGVPGEWSPPIPLKIRMQNPILLRPTPQDKVSDPLVKFEWGPVQGADQYQLLVRDKNKKILHNGTTKELKNAVYIDRLGSLEWTVVALEKDEDMRSPEDIQDASFRSFERVGGVLEAPVVSLKVSPKVLFSWQKVKNAEYYDVEYLPPVDSKEKNRLFKLKRNSLQFDHSKLREGVTTLTVSAGAQGHENSPKSLVKIFKDKDKVEVEDVVQGKETVDVKTVPTETFFKDEVLLGVGVAQYGYKSNNAETDTHLNQDSLTSLGLFAEWNRRPNINSLNRKAEVGLFHLSSGIDAAIAFRLASTLHKEKKFSRWSWTYGGGASFLALPAFMGDRFTNNVNASVSSGLGPEFQTGFNYPFGRVSELQGNLSLAYQAITISSRKDGGPGFPWIKGHLRVLRYFGDKQAFFAQTEFQSWDQKWGDDSSQVAGLGVNFGLKAGF